MLMSDFNKTHFKQISKALICMSMFLTRYADRQYQSNNDNNLILV